MIIRKITLVKMYAVIATDSVAARGLVNGRCLPRSGRRDILSVANVWGNFADYRLKLF